MRAERDRRAAILTAEGTKQSAILTAEGQRQAAILAAEGDAKAAILRADGEAQAIQKVFDAIHKGNPDQKLLAYQYLQTLPKIAEGSSNKLWIIPSEVGEASRASAERSVAPTADPVSLTCSAIPNKNRPRNYRQFERGPATISLAGPLRFVLSASIRV
ncbi:uncharacterized protein Mb1524 [Arthrobacter sp. Hiyo8]|nr:uncharacterized protein Mb1524 [Arthrobacter sp. Hiyo8]